MISAPIIVLDNVSFAYSDGKIQFKNISFKVERGGYILISGPSGAGKSTLLRLIARLDEASEGRLLFNGKAYDEYPPSALRQKVAFIQQTPTIFPGNVYDNLLLPFFFTVNRELRKPTKDELIKYLNQLKLENIIDQEAQTLSVGQKQRVSILRTLLLEPDVILMDEPTSALDMESKDIVETLSEELNRKGKTILMINHSAYKPKSVNYKTIRISNGVIEAL